MPRYHINLFWSDKDDAWIADVAHLGSVAAHGKSPLEALREAEMAINAALGVLQKTAALMSQPCNKAAA